MNNYNNVLLISEDLIKSITNISDNISGDYLFPSIKLAQDIELQETIGTYLLQYIQELIANNNISNEENEKYKYLLDNYIQPYIAYQTLVYLAPTVSFKIANAGVLRTEDEKMFNVSFNETSKVADYYKHIANSYKYRLQRFLIANYNKYPQLLKYRSIADLRANLYSAASVGLSLGGARGKRIFNSAYWDYGYNFPNADIDIR